MMTIPSRGQLLLKFAFLCVAFLRLLVIARKVQALHVVDRTSTMPTTSTTTSGRRQALIQTSGLLTSCAPLITNASKLTKSEAKTPAAESAQSPIFLADSSSTMFDMYQVETDASSAMQPHLNRLASKENVMERLAAIPSGAIWLGEHHSSLQDHQLQLQILKDLHSRRKPGMSLVLGLEQVEIQFQPILDLYNQGSISLDDMRVGVQWDIRWVWPFDIYRDIFRVARDELAIPLLALNVNREDLLLVQRNGLPGLPRDRLLTYIPDAPGFATFCQQESFKHYVNYVIQPSYVMHRDLGLLKVQQQKQDHDQESLNRTMSFRSFLSGRLLWDEAMASAAFKWTRQHKNSLIIGLVGLDHVKFGAGIPGRFGRMTSEDAQTDCVSILLNPTPIDTRPSGLSSMDVDMSFRNPESITLQLQYKEKSSVDYDSIVLDNASVGILPLADYLVISDYR